MGSWEEIDRPVLMAVQRLEDEGQDVKTETLAVAGPFDYLALQKSLRRLHDAEYLTGIDVTTQTSTFELIAIRLLERGFVVIGEWPSDAYEDLLESLDRALNEEPDDERKGKLRKLRDGILAAGRDVAVSVLSE